MCNLDPASTLSELQLSAPTNLLWYYLISKKYSAGENYLIPRPLRRTSIGNALQPNNKKGQKKENKNNTKKSHVWSPVFLKETISHTR